METLKQVSLTWFRAAAAAAIALYLAGETDLKVLGTAALAGFLGPVLKWLDPSAPEFGRKKKDKVNGTGRWHFMKNRYGADGLTFGSKIDTSTGKIDVYETPLIEWINFVIEKFAAILCFSLPVGLPSTNGRATICYRSTRKFTQSYPGRTRVVTRSFLGSAFS